MTIERAYASASDTLDQTSYTQVDSMTLTPPSGNYLAIFNMQVQFAPSTITASTLQIQIYVDGSPLAYTIRKINQNDSLDEAYTYTTTAALVSVNGSQAVEVRYVANNGTTPMTGTKRELNLFPAVGTNYQDTDDFEDSSFGTWEDLASMSRTPASGNYLCVFSTTCTCSVPAQTVGFRLSVGGTPVAHTIRYSHLESSAEPAQYIVMIVASINPNGSEEVKIEFARIVGSGIVYSYQRNMILIGMPSADIFQAQGTVTDSESTADTDKQIDDMIITTPGARDYLVMFNSYDFYPTISSPEGLTTYKIYEDGAEDTNLTRLIEHDAVLDNTYMPLCVSGRITLGSGSIQAYWRANSTVQISIYERTLIAIREPFPTEWNRRCELKIQASKVSSTLTNFPVLLTLDTLPSEMFDADGSYPALSGGGDIRFSTDQAGTSRLACEIIVFTIDNDPANGVAEIWVNVPSVSSSVDTSIWVWYNKTGESQPGEAEAYGKHATWNSAFETVQHLNDATTSTITDSTGNSNDGTKVGANEPIEIDGAWGGSKGQNFDGSNDYIDIGEAPFDIIGNITVEAWIKVTNFDIAWQNIISKGDSAWRFTRDDVSNFLHFAMNGLTPRNVDGTVNVNDAGWHYIVGVYDGSSLYIYVDGTEDNSAAQSGTPTNNNFNVYIGENSETTGRQFDGVIDEIRVSTTDRNLGWISACFNNQDDPATFVLEQTPQSPGTYKLEGVTYDKTGSILGSVDCYLYKDNQDNTVTFVDYVVSNVSTGVYSFTGLTDNDAQYIVVGIEDSGTNRFDMTDNVRTPVAE